MRVLIACEFSGIVRDAFLAKGHDAWSCDIIDTEITGPHIKGDVLDILDQDWDLMIAHPPCTYLTVVGNKWFKPEYSDRFPNRQQQKEDAVDFFMVLVNASIPRIAVENPVGIISTRWRKPDQIINPFEYGNPYSKKTCLWLKNLPLLRSTNIVDKGEQIRFKSGRSMSKWFVDTCKLSPEERTKARSRTFKGIADAMASQWSK